MAKKQTKKTAAIKFDTDWTYAPAPESKDHIRLEEKYDLFIDGKFTPPSSGKYFETINPATRVEYIEQKAAQIQISPTCRK